MRKLYLLLSSCLFIFTSCTFFSDDGFSDRITTNKPLEIQESIQEFSGKIESLKSVSISSRATHLLITDEREMEVNSPNISLDPFLGKEVKITGNMLSYPGNIQVFTIKTIESLEKEKPEVSSLKNYTDKESRFSFSYPSNWQVFWAQKVTIIKENDETIVKITRLDNPQNLKLSDFVKESFEEVTVAEKVALKVIRTDGFDIYFSANNEIVKMSFLDSQKNQTLEDSFISFLQSLSFPEIQQENIRCGGADESLCPQGYRCEITGGTFGMCIQIDAKTVPRTDLSAPAVPEPQTLINPDTVEGSTYENTMMSYRLQVPRGWWWKSFGPTDNTLWHTEFSEKEIENIEDGSIIVDVKLGARGKIEESNFGILRIFVPRDESSHFEVFGSTEMKIPLQNIANSLISTY